MAFELLTRHIFQDDCPANVKTNYLCLIASLRQPSYNGSTLVWQFLLEWVHHLHHLSIQTLPVVFGLFTNILSWVLCSSSLSAILCYCDINYGNCTCTFNRGIAILSHKWYYCWLCSWCGFSTAIIWYRSAKILWEYRPSLLISYKNALFLCFCFFQFQFSLPTVFKFPWYDD